MPAARDVGATSDGNLVDYDNGVAFWASATAGHPGAYATFKAGILSVVSPSGTVLWHSGPSTVGGGATLNFDNTVHVDDVQGRPYWWASSGVNLSYLSLTPDEAVSVGTANHELIMQLDGNFVY